MTKTVQVRIRLTPSAEQGLAAQCALTQEEHTACKIAAHAAGYITKARGLSTWMRDVAERAALRSREKTEHRLTYTLLVEAAAEAHLSLGGFVRAVCLEAAGVSMLGAQLASVGKM